MTYIDEEAVRLWRLCFS